MLVSWLLNALVHNFEDKKMTWLLFGLIAVSDRLYGGRQAAPVPRPVRPQPAPKPASTQARVVQRPG
jgi:hypothetical protein